MRAMPERVTSLFSAHAEVFPMINVSGIEGPALLRTRGGISIYIDRSYYARASSPHTRRYFHAPIPSASLSGLFSAHAEVFPAPAYSIG